MPLKTGYSRKTINANIAEMMRSYNTNGMIGHTRPPSRAAAGREAAAIAYSKARDAWRAQHKGRPVPLYLRGTPERRQRVAQRKPDMLHQTRNARRAVTGAAMIMPAAGLLANPTAAGAAQAAGVTAAMIPMAVIPEVSDRLVDAAMPRRRPPRPKVRRQRVRR